MIIGAHNHVNEPEKVDHVKQSPEEIVAVMNRVDVDKAFVFPFNMLNSNVTHLANVPAYEKSFGSSPSKERKHS